MTETQQETATCPDCGRENVPVNKSGSLRKHDCVPPASTETEPAAAAVDEPGPAAAAGDDAQGEPGGDATFGDGAAAAGGTGGELTTADVARIFDVPEAMLTKPAAAPAERASCKRANCGRKPHRHGWCAQDHATHCQHGR